MTFESLLTTYWSQSVLILTMIVGLIGYFGKRYFDLKTKKKEVNHTLYQNMAFAAIKDFFKAYAEIIDLLKKKPEEFFDKSIKEVDEIVYAKALYLDHQKIYAALFVNDTLGSLLNKITLYNHDIYNYLCDLVVDNFEPNFNGIDERFKKQSDAEKRKFKVTNFILFRNDRERKMSLLIDEFKKQLELSLN